MISVTYTIIFEKVKAKMTIISIKVGAKKNIISIKVGAKSRFCVVSFSIMKSLKRKMSNWFYIFGLKVLNGFYGNDGF